MNSRKATAATPSPTAKKTVEPRRATVVVPTRTAMVAKPGRATAVIAKPGKATAATTVLSRNISTRRSTAVNKRSFRRFLRFPQTWKGI